MVVLAEEELVVIDLKSPGWPSVQPPYLASLHCSAITCSHHVSNIPLKLWERIISAGSKQNSHFSNMVGPCRRIRKLKRTCVLRKLKKSVWTQAHSQTGMEFWGALQIFFFEKMFLLFKGVQEERKMISWH